nr:hypothetical protein [Synechococcus sp. GFB01]
MIFPFEEAIFNAHGRRFATYVGHPLLDGLEVSRDRVATRRVHGFSDAQSLLVLMPGSRRSEVRLLLPAMLRAAERLKRDGWQVALVQAPTVPESYLRHVAGGRLPVPLISGDTYNLLAAADVGLIASGTATLEAALLGCPPVIVYRFSWFTYLLARLAIGRRAIGLPNVVLGRAAFPELIQRQVQPARLVEAVCDLTSRSDQNRQLVAELRSRMGTAGASGRAADLMLELLP